MVRRTVLEIGFNLKGVERLNSTHRLNQSQTQLNYIKMIQSNCLKGVFFLRKFILLVYY